MNSSGSYSRSTAGRQHFKIYLISPVFNDSFMTGSLRTAYNYTSSSGFWRRNYHAGLTLDHGVEWEVSAECRQILERSSRAFCSHLNVSISWIHARRIHLFQSCLRQKVLQGVDQYIHILLGVISLDRDADEVLTLPFGQRHLNLIFIIQTGFEQS